MKNKKGFTLIELLAVIVILAIIALIATPIVLNIIKDSKENAQLRSAEFYLDGVEQIITKKMMDDPTFKVSKCEIQQDGNLKCDGRGDVIEIEVSGEKPSSGKICLSSKGIVDKVMVKYNNYYVSHDGKNTNITDKDTFDSFSCVGNSVVVVPNRDIEFIDGEDVYIALLTECLDSSLFEYGNYYNVVLTDESGTEYNNNLIYQNTDLGMQSLTDPFSVSLASTKEMLLYQHIPSQNLCAFAVNSDSNNNYKYKGKYQFRIETNNEKVEPNYVFRLSINEYGKIRSFSFYSSELKFKDEVEIEFVGKQTFTTTVCDGCKVESQDLYNDIYYKNIGRSFSSGSELQEPTDVNITINNEKTYNFKKEDFKQVNVEGGTSCVRGNYYYVGNNDIDDVDGC